MAAFLPLLYNERMNMRTIVLINIVCAVLFLIGGIAFGVGNIKRPETKPVEWYRIVFSYKDSNAGREVVLQKDEAAAVFGGLKTMKKMCTDPSLSEIRLDKLEVSSDPARVAEQAQAVFSESGVKNIQPYEWVTESRQTKCESLQ